MVSAATIRERLRSRNCETPEPEGLRLVGTSWRGHAWRVLSFSVPFVALAWYVLWAGFLSDAHAHVVAKALVAADRGRLEVIGFAYPPLPYLLATLWPSAWWVTALAGLAGGATAWLLWYDLRRTSLPFLVRTVLLASVILTPSFVLLATQAFADVLALHLLLVSWFYYLNFVRQGHTWSGFTAGLVLGLAFFASFYAVVFALAYALASPVYAGLQADEWERSREADLARAVVILFPPLWALASWSYVSWVFTGEPLRVFTDPASPVAIPTDVGTLARAFERAVTETAREFALQPLFAVVTLLAWVYGHRRVLALIAVPLVVMVIRTLGFSFGGAFALVLYAVIALVALPRRLSVSWGALLVLVALAQAAVTSGYAADAGDYAAWHGVVTTGQVDPAARAERDLAGRLSQAPPRSILTDDQEAYRLIALAGTARPFLLSADPSFSAALESPVDHAQYVLVAARARDDRALVSARFSAAPPAGFVLDGVLSGWALYRRVDVPSLLTGTGG